MKNKRISIVVPAYNEEKRIGDTLKDIRGYCDGNVGDYEIIVVDDCSEDKTLEVVSGHMCGKIVVILNEKNMGKGYSVKRGILEAKYPLVLYSDGDLATPIEELERLVHHLDKGYDVVFASRNLRESNVVNANQPLYRRIIGRFFPFLVTGFLWTDFKDTQCGFKLFKTDSAKKIIVFQTINRFAFDAEILLIAKKMGLRIKEVPVTWVNKEGGTVNVLTDGLKMLSDLIKIKLNDFSGVYDTQMIQ